METIIRNHHRVMGLDLAIGLNGFAIMDKGPKLIYTGTFTPPSRRKNENRGVWNRRRRDFFEKKLRELIDQWQPGFLAYEFPDKPRSAWTWGGRRRTNKGVEFHAMQGLGLAEGILVSICPKEMPLYAISTSEAKKFVTGRASASKISVRDWLQMHLNIHFPEDITDDETDAACIAYAFMTRYMP